MYAICELAGCHTIIPPSLRNTLKVLQSLPLDQGITADTILQTRAARGRQTKIYVAGLAFLMKGMKNGIKLTKTKHPN